MDTKNWEYKNIQLSNRNVAYNFQVEEVEDVVNYNSSIYENQISNGGFSTSTTLGVRVFTFSGSIF